MSQHRTSFSSQPGLFPGDSLQSRRASSSSSSIDELLTPSPGPSISSLNPANPIGPGGTVNPLLQPSSTSSSTSSVLNNRSGSAVWPKYRGSFSQDGNDIDTSPPINAAKINQDIWKATSPWSSSSTTVAANPADSLYRTTSGASATSEASSLNTARRASNGGAFLVASEAETRRSTSLFGLTPSSNEPSTNSLFRSLSGGSPFFPSGTASLSSVNSAGGPISGSGTESRNLLDRFAYLGEATREIEMLNGFRKMGLNGGGSSTGEGSSLTSPYVSPPQTYATPAAGQQQQQQPNSLFGTTTTSATSRSSSFGNGVWQQPPPPSMSANLDDKSYPLDSYAGASTYNNGIQQQPQQPQPQMYQNEFNYSDEISSSPSSQTRKLSYSAVASGADATAQKEAPALSPSMPTNTTTPAGSSFRPSFAFQNFQNSVKFVPRNTPIPSTADSSVPVSAPGTGTASHSRSTSYNSNSGGYDFVMTGGQPTFKSRNAGASGPGSAPAPSTGANSRRKGGHSESANARSALLEEFRNNKSRKFTLADLHDHVVEFSSDQHGSRFIQHKLESATDEEKDALFSEIRPQSLQLMTDVFGNYVIQKFFELGSDLQRTILAKQMESHILDLSLQMYGCRVVQKAIEHVPNDQQVKLVKELDGHVLRCVKDQNGNHVIQKAIERIPPERIGFIMDSFHDQIYQLATHPYGCRVIQRMLEYSSEKAQRDLLDELHTYAFYLVEDQYGNYVIQHVIEHGKKQDKDKVIDLVKNSIMTFSRHKFASNVVEKCIIFGSEQQKRDMIDMILTSKADGTVPISVMMKDQFANYVIQKLLDSTSGDEHDRLVVSIKPHLNALKKFSYGKHLASIEKLVGPENGFEDVTGGANGNGYSKRK